MRLTTVITRSIWWIEFLSLARKRNPSKATHVLWIPRTSPTYMFRTAIIWDTLVLRFFIENQIPFDVKIGLKSIGSIIGKKVVYNPQYDFDPFQSPYENRIYPVVSDILESNNNVVSPSAADIKYWENKEFMYNQFKLNKIPHPETFIFKSQISLTDARVKDLEDYIIKPSFSKSSIGIEKVRSVAQIAKILAKDNVAIIQRIADISRDCRIIVVNGEIVLQYWRNKVSSPENRKDFVTTATGNGSTVSFNNYSDTIKRFALENTKKLGLESAAWDLIETEDGILALEVSPVYYPNANRGYDENTPYREYKNKRAYQREMRLEFEKHVLKRLS